MEINLKHYESLIHSDTVSYDLHFKTQFMSWVRNSVSRVPPVDTQISGSRVPPVDTYLWSRVPSVDTQVTSHCDPSTSYYWYMDTLVTTNSSSIQQFWYVSYVVITPEDLRTWQVLIKRGTAESTAHNDNTQNNCQEYIRLRKMWPLEFLSEFFWDFFWELSLHYVPRPIFTTHPEFFWDCGKEIPKRTRFVPPYIYLCLHHLSERHMMFTGLELHSLDFWS